MFEQECYGPLKKECYDKVQGYSEISDLTFSLDDVEKLLKGVIFIFIRFLFSDLFRQMYFGFLTFCVFQ